MNILSQLSRYQLDKSFRPDTTYKKHDGYAPIFAYVGTEGYMLDNELRPGSQHSQKETPEFIARCVQTLDTLDLNGKALLRLDSGNDAADNFERLGENYFIVKRNLRKECPEQWLANARRLGEAQESRDGKNVYVGFVDHLCPGGDGAKTDTVPVVFEVIEPLTDPAMGNIVKCFWIFYVIILSANDLFP